MSLQANVAAAFAECNETFRLLTEWREARRAILDTDWSDPTKLRPDLWVRLGHAEAALMAYARTLPPTTKDNAS